MYEAPTLPFSPNFANYVKLVSLLDLGFLVRVTASDGVLVLSPLNFPDDSKISARLACVFVSNLMRVAYDGLIALHGSVPVRICLYGVIIHPFSV